MAEIESLEFIEAVMKIKKGEQGFLLVGSESETRIGRIHILAPITIVSEGITCKRVKKKEGKQKK